jgi:hypothetical protein
MPTFECSSQLLIEHSSPDLQETMCAVRRPPHLLLFDEPFADYLVDSGLNEPRRNRLAVPMTIGGIRDYRHIRCDVVYELLEFLL